jgi:hypothetical protein
MEDRTAWFQSFAVKECISPELCSRVYIPLTYNIMSTYYISEPTRGINEQ